ncbi:hypothetical protein R3I93_008130 [Phoxinus phoxinus]|uniref:Ig-like domain-containing protein n=1 Tax=Phoxinus phoxinus TaxID=58324 RepID=A0AAN9HBD2_9TELE
MIQTRNVVILLALLLASTLAEEDPEPIFKVLGRELEMGFCFGDDIAVYRLTAGKRELLGQYSKPLISPPDAFKGRINTSIEYKGLLGLKITNLQFSDSGTYITECWSGNTMDNYRKHYIYVCNEEFGSQEISLTPGTGADLVCNMGSRQRGTVKWYRELHNISLFMDTQISFEPLQAEFKSLIRVHDKGSILHVSDEFIQDRARFFCLVMEREQCRSFQTIGQPEDPEMKSVYRSVGEKLVLTCSVDHLRQNHWKTPFGQVNSSAPLRLKGTTENQMSMSTSMNSEVYSLVIHPLTSEHSGSYKCFSTFLVEEYVVSVCPLLESTHISFSPGDKKVLLQCDFMSLPAINNKVEYISVLWYRNTGEQDIQIMDSGDPSLTLPKDLQGRVKFSQINSALILTDPKVEDNGMYWCVVLLDNDENYDDKDTDFNNDGGDEEDEVELYPLVMEEEYMDMCLFMQVTNLTFQPESEPESKSEPETSQTKYIVGAGLGGLLALAFLVGIVAVIKMRKKRSASVQGRDLELSEEEGRALKSTKT